MFILVFKTNIRYSQDLNRVQETLSQHETILQWNVDRWDAENILRIESSNDSTNEIINSMNSAGFHCEALED